MAPRRTIAAITFLSSFLIASVSASGQIVSLPGVRGVVVVEATGGEHTYSFGIRPVYDPRLGSPNVEPIGPNNCDICTDANEFYDVFISNLDGKADKNGKFITIKYNYAGTGQNYAVGGNIDAVGIVFGDGKPTKWATFVNRVRPGTGLTLPPFKNTHGFARNILGEPDGTITYLGDGEGQIQVGFSMPEGSSFTMLLCGAAPLGILGLRRFRRR